MSTLLISAIDTLFFGSGRPFTMGEESWTSSNFYPSPETLYGYLRSNYLKSYMSDIIKIDTPDDPTKALVIDNFGVCMKLNNIYERLYKLPKDIILNNTNTECDTLKCKKSQNPIISNSQLNLEFTLENSRGDEFDFPDDGAYYLTESDFNSYLNGNVRNLNLKKEEDLISKEYKLGINRDRFDSKKKSLYRTVMHRMENANAELFFWLKYEGMTAPTISLNRLGGEGKLAKTWDISDFSVIGVDRIEKGKILKVYVYTPLIPEKDEFYPRIKDAKLITASCYKPLRIGGYDAVNRRPKASRRAIAPGSVFYYEVNQDINPLPEKLGLDKKKGYGKCIYSII